jgi:polyisoprenoid-binding protein YceI
MACSPSPSDASPASLWFVPSVLARAVILALLLPVGNAHAATSSAWQILAGEIRVTCPLTVGGSFDAKTTAVAGEYRADATSSDSWLGTITVDLATLETGIALRDEHMRDTYLEVGKGGDFSRAVLSQVRLSAIDRDTLTGRGTFTASLRLHGVERAVTGKADIRRSGEHLRVKASFPLKIADFGIATPRYLGVGVKDEVTVQVTLESSSGEEGQ